MSLHAKMLDGDLRDLRGIPNAGLTDFDDFLRNQLRDWVAAILESEQFQGSFVSGA